MASTYTPPVQTLIDELGRLPGIGPKSAQRIAFHLLKVPSDDVARLAHALTDAKARVRFCDRCFNIAEDALCPICLDDNRDTSVVCVVEESRDIVALEKTGEFRGRYHVLLGAMSPLGGDRSRAVEDPRAADAHRPRGHHRGDHLHEPEHRGRGDGDVPRPDAQAARPDDHPDRQRAARSAAISSTPTNSRSAGPSRAAGPWTDDPQPSAWDSGLEND